ncbi:MAG: PUR family DNA/RNA-binding protein [Caldiserica bacterium]|nr:PUR family DNA/RNA-binding protein [Caldisericota bacterium]
MAEELLTKSLKCGKRIYHFNLKKTTGGNKYLDIVEIRPQGDTREKDRIVIFEDHIEEFMSTLSDMASNLLEEESPEDSQ